MTSPRALALLPWKQGARSCSCTARPLSRLDLPRLERARAFAFTSQTASRALRSALLRSHEPVHPLQLEGYAGNNIRRKLGSPRVGETTLRKLIEKALREHREEQG